MRDADARRCLAQTIACLLVFVQEALGPHLLLVEAGRRAVLESEGDRLPLGSLLQPPESPPKPHAAHHVPLRCATPPPDPPVSARRGPRRVPPPTAPRGPSCRRSARRGAPGSPRRASPR